MESEDQKKRGEETEAESIYRKLQKHLDRMPIGYPKTDSGIEIKILKDFFNEEEAEIATHLSMMPEMLWKVYIRIKLFSRSDRSRLKNITYEQLRKKLKDMGDRGIIISKYYLNGRITCYRQAMLAIGLYEFQANKLTKEFVEDLDDYWDEEFGDEMWSTKENQLRTIPIEKSVEYKSQVYKYEDVRKLVTNARRIGVTNCVCRDGMDLKGESCKQTELRESCLVFDNVADYYLNHDLAREITAEKAFHILEQCQKDGLVLQPGNSKRLDFICTCCSCCCEVLRRVKNFPNPAEYYTLTYVARVNNDDCKGCGLCAKNCPTDAISLSGDFAIVSNNRCIACGLCVSNCPTGAVTFMKRSKINKPPQKMLGLHLRILRKKHGPFYVAWLMIKFLLGFKV